MEAPDYLRMKRDCSISLQSSVAPMVLTSAGTLPPFSFSGPVYLPPSKKKTGALKQRRASKRRKNRRRS
ncbi:hypothetical protein VT85_22250 [Planctomyces sp. SH-PL62]|nr:hypothetical protein VT85_22250 [Planctomyces sp. SH-PL62]